jgi:hypothetical protein
MIPKTPEYVQFQSSVPFRSALQDILNNEQLKQAIALVKSCAAPRFIPQSAPGLHPDTSTAHVYHMMAGVHQAFDLLEQLTMPPVNRLSPDEPEFYHALPSEYRDAPIHLE